VQDSITQKRGVPSSSKFGVRLLSRCNHDKRVKKDKKKKEKNKKKKAKKKKKKKEKNARVLGASISL